MPIEIETWIPWRERVAEWLRGPPCPVHFVGIGGVGMAGIAFHLHGRGFAVTGSDVEPTRFARWLSSLGVSVCYGHDAACLPDSARFVVRTPAVPPGNPECSAAEARGIPVVPRGVVLPAMMATVPRSIAVSGTHGKTTTAAMIARILVEAGWDPATCIGGEAPGLDGVARTGSGEWIVVEADESDGTVALYEPEVAVVTNIEYDHMEHFDSEETFRARLAQFAGQARGFVTVCADDPAARAVGTAERTVRYGMGEQAAWRLVDPAFEAERSTATLMAPDGAEPLLLRLAVPGRHNLLNGGGAAATALSLGVPRHAVQSALASFAPVRRRFEVVRRDDRCTVVSDYAHHPTEIRAVIDTAGRWPRRRLRAVYQPHRYTRTRALLRDFPPAFAGLDELILAPVYAASEPPLEGGRSEDLLGACRAQGSVPVRLASGLEEAWRWMKEDHEAGDMVLILGAGDVESLATRAVDEL